MARGPATAGCAPGRSRGYVEVEHVQLRRDKFEIDGLRDYLVFNPLTNLFKPERGPRDTI